MNAYLMNIGPAKHLLITDVFRIQSIGERGIVEIDKRDEGGILFTALVISLRPGDYVILQ